jgi:phytoene synthase
MEAGSMTGWDTSAEAWINVQGEHGDFGRQHVLDAPMQAVVAAHAPARVIDIGCGEGRFCRMLAARGIATTGIDPAAALIDQARRLHPDGDYHVAAAETMAVADGGFDMAVCYLSLIDMPDLDAALARTDPDRWLSSRFAAGADARRALVALYAFDQELARAPRSASTPLVGEMRLAWWGEVLAEMASGGPVRRHPVAQALAEAARTFSLDPGALEALVDVRYRELDPRPLTLEEALEWADGTGGGCAVLAASILDPDCDPGAARAGGPTSLPGRATPAPRHDTA